ncbi:hypothetical protein [Spirosoma luteum]|uniref:hypothetical protein n=1 Tax=Spirosoma luteum TaxID=431553 RepID=UPI00036ACD12|nr:hypothetical protein [Spirosoma luteum]
MKRILIIGSMLSIGLLISASGQSNPSPTTQPATATPGNTKQIDPAQKKISQQERRRKEAAMDTTLPGKRKGRRLRPDSLRRGGVTKVDTV